MSGPVDTGGMLAELEWNLRRLHAGEPKPRRSALGLTAPVIPLALAGLGQAAAVDPLLAVGGVLTSAALALRLVRPGGLGPIVLAVSGLVATTLGTVLKVAGVVHLVGGL